MRRPLRATLLVLLMLPRQSCWPSRFSHLVLLPRPTPFPFRGLPTLALAAVLSAPWPSCQLARLLISSLL